MLVSTDGGRHAGSSLCYFFCRKCLGLPSNELGARHDSHYTDQETAAESDEHQDAPDHAQDSPDVGQLFAFWIHCTGTNLRHIAIAHDPGNRREDSANDDAENAKD